jgi:hypothetical protein
MKREHTQNSIVRSPADSQLEIMLALDVDLTNSQFVGITGGNVDGDGNAELIVLPSAPSGAQVTNVCREEKWPSFAALLRRSLIGPLVGRE